MKTMISLSCVDHQVLGLSGQLHVGLDSGEDETLSGP